MTLDFWAEDMLPEDEPKAETQAKAAPEGGPPPSRLSSDMARRLLEEVQERLKAVDIQINEVGLMLDRSRTEVERLAQHSAALLAYLRQNAQRGRVENVVQELETTLEAQQRFLLLRGQMEKLEMERKHLQEARELLLTLQDVLESVLPLLEQTDESRVAANELVRMVLQAEQNVRRRVARQMHDGPAQTLSNLILQTEIVKRVAERTPNQLPEELRTLEDLAQKAFRSVRTFVTELRPMALDDLGLAPTLQRYLNTLKHERKLEVNLNLTGQPRRLESYLEMLAFRVVQEVLFEAESVGTPHRLDVLLDFQNPRQLFLRVRVEGLGLDALPSEPQTEDLRLLQEQVNMLGGTLRLLPHAQGRTVEVTLPEG